MIFYKCNHCKKEYCIPKVKLTGFSSSNGDILIEGGATKDFCSRNCLIEWISKEDKDKK